jgi:uncharacterized membrane protein
MKAAFAILGMVALIAVFGCTRKSPRGGIVPRDEGFSITVPKFNTIRQGADATVVVSLNRGAYFKRDVQLDITAGDIGVTPSSVLVKASDVPDVQLKIVVPRDAAIGEHRVSVRGTPETGGPTSVEFTVKVVAQ